MFFDRKAAHQTPHEDLANLKITDARVGDTLSITGAAEDFSDIDFNVDRLERYEAGTRNWLELSGTWRDRRIYLEVHREDPVQVLGNFDGRTITLDELALSEDDLAQIDERQNQADFFDYDGKFWLYRFSREVLQYSAAYPGGLGFYCWQFQEQGGKRFLIVRKFEGQPFVAFIRTQVNPGDITVFRGS
jgi:hypothetical protein